MRILYYFTLGVYHSTTRVGNARVRIQSGRKIFWDSYTWNSTPE